MGNKLFSWIKRLGVKISESKSQYITNPSEFYLICEVEGYQGKYDGKKHSITLAVLEDCLIRYSFDKKSWSSKKPELKDVCETECYIQVFRNKRIEETKVIINITPRNLLLISESACKEYDGKELSNSQVIVAGDGLADGDSFSVVAVGKRILVGSTENSIQYSFPNIELAKNYVVITRPGEIVIETRREKYLIYLQGKNESFVYDGYNHIIDGFERNSFLINGNYYYVLGVDARASLCDVGVIKTECVGTLRVEDKSGNDVTGQFEVLIVPGILKIEKRNIELVSGSAEKEYDGSALTCHEYQINGDGLAVGDRIDVIFNAEQLLVGSCENVVEFHFENGNMSNYNVKITPGRIKVSNRIKKYQIILNGKKNSVLYDGKEYEIEGVEESKIEIDNKLYYVDGISTSIKGKEPGKYKGVVCGNPIVRDEYGNDVTDQFDVEVEPGILQIVDRQIPYAITIQGKSLTKKYNRTEQILEEKIDRFVEVDLHRFHVSGLTLKAIGIHAGVVQTKTEGSLLITDMSGNDVTRQFAVTIIPGTLTILPREVKIISASETREYNGCKLENKGTQFEGDGFLIFEVPVITFENSQCIVGKCKNSFSFKMPQGVCETDYSIQVEFGTLEVIDRKKKYQVPCPLKDVDELYDGKMHFLVDAYEDVVEIHDIPFKINVLYSSQFAVDAGIYPFEITEVNVFDSNNNNVTKQFEVNITSGALTVLKRTLNLSSESIEKEYDGISLVSDKIFVSGDGFAEGEGLEYTFLNSQLLPGTVINEFTYYPNKNTSIKNYNITCSYGQLSVINRVEPIYVKIYGESRNCLYDKEEKELPEFKELSFEYNGNLFYISGISNRITGIEEGTYSRTDIESYHVCDVEQNDVTDQFKIDAHPGTLTIEHNTAYDVAIPDGKEERMDQYDIAVQEILEKMTGRKSSADIKKFSRKELADRFVDDKELLKGKGKIDPKYEKLLIERAERDELDVLSNKIAREFKNVTLLSEIEISDREFNLLMYYFRKRYTYVKENYRKSFIDIVFAVAMVQIGIRYYENNLWSQVCSVGNIDLELNDRNWVGGSVTETLLAFGKPVYEKHEYVTNVLMHCFITDAFANRFFDYLFQYYRSDLERDISGLQDIDLEYLCTNIINPYTKRQQLLSNYMAMSIRAGRKYCKEIISKALTMIDCSFWDEEYPEACLSGRLADRFEEWKDISQFYKVEKQKRQNENNNRDKLYMYRKPHMICDVNKGIFHIVLPSQIVPGSETEIPNVIWIVVSKTQKQFSCELMEGFSGYRTKEIEFVIERESIFDKYIFLLFSDDKLLRRFDWEEKQAQFFKDDGRWMSGTKLEEGRTLAFVNSTSKIRSKAIQYQGYEFELLYYELNIQNGDFVLVEGEENYYVGDIPQPGLSEIGMLSGIYVSMEDEQNNIKVYDRYPEIVIEIEEHEYKGTAIIVNGTVNKLSQANFIDVKSGKISTKKYYFVNSEELKGIKDGYNQIIIDYPQSRKKLNLECFIMKDFEFEFQNAPYIFVDEGSLNINRYIVEKIVFIETLSSMNRIPFQMSDLKDGILTIQGSRGIKLNFYVPMLYFSWDRKEWSYSKSEDIWHGDLNRIIYLKYPEEQISLFVEGQQERACFNYRKKTDGIFDCDITKMLSYFSEFKILEAVILKANGIEKTLFRVLQKSFLVNATLQPSYNTHQIEAQLDILGKGSYYADLYCGDEIIAEKEPVSDELRVSFDVGVETAEYTIKIFESEEEFGFDEDYDFVGEKSVELLNPADLLGGCMRIIDIVNKTDRTRFSIDNNYRYYVYLEEQYSATKYKAILTGIFYKENYVMYASNAIVEIPDINNAETIMIERINEKDSIEAFCYNYKKQAIVDLNYSSTNQELIFLNKENVSLHVEFISPSKIRRDRALKWIDERAERRKKKFSIWKEK